jgi:hypothetical protein
VAVRWIVCKISSSRPAELAGLRAGLVALTDIRERFEEQIRAGALADLDQ